MKRFPLWFFALMALAGAVSLRNNFGTSRGFSGFVLGTLLPIVCGLSAIVLVGALVLKRSRRAQNGRDGR